MKAAPKRAAPSENDDEVQFIKCSKRQAMTAPASSSKKKSKASGSTPKVSPSLSCNQAIVFANLNAKVFPLIPVSQPEEDSLAAIQSIKSDDLTQITLRSELLSQIRGSVVVLRDRIHRKRDSQEAREPNKSN